VRSQAQYLVSEGAGFHLSVYEACRTVGKDINKNPTHECIEITINVTNLFGPPASTGEQNNIRKILSIL